MRKPLHTPHTCALFSLFPVQVPSFSWRNAGKPGALVARCAMSHIGYQVHIGAWLNRRVVGTRTLSAGTDAWLKRGRLAREPTRGSNADTGCRQSHVVRTQTCGQFCATSATSFRSLSCRTLMASQASIIGIVLPIEHTRSPRIGIPRHWDPRHSKIPQ